jgi:hypothetical protein
MRPQSLDVAAEKDREYTEQTDSLSPGNEAGMSTDTAGLDGAAR